MAKSIYQQRKAEGKCVRQGCDEKPQKNPDGTRRSYCDTHNKENRKNSDAYAARQGKTKKKAKKRVDPDPVKTAPIGKRAKRMDDVFPATVPATAPTTVEVTPEPAAISRKPSVKLTEAELVTFNAAVAERMERTGQSRKVASQFVRRQAAKA